MPPAVFCDTASVMPAKFQSASTVTRGGKWHPSRPWISRLHGNPWPRAGTSSMVQPFSSPSQRVVAPPVKVESQVALLALDSCNSSRASTGYIRPGTFYLCSVLTDRSQMGAPLPDCPARTGLVGPSQAHLARHEGLTPSRMALAELLILLDSGARSHLSDYPGIVRFQKKPGWAGCLEPFQTHELRWRNCLCQNHQLVRAATRVVSLP